MTHTTVICTKQHIERNPDLTVALIIKLTQTIKQKHISTQEGIETKLKKTKKTKDYIKKLLTDGKSERGPCIFFDGHNLTVQN